MEWFHAKGIGQIPSTNHIGWPKDMNNDLHNRVVTGTTEASDLDFKLEWDYTRNADCLEIVKDIIAMANSGGGAILIGADDNGNPVNPADPAKRCDPAVLNDKIFKYTGIQPTFVEMGLVERSGVHLQAIFVGEADIPIPFLNPGTYELPDKKQKTVFGKGTVYFRHSAKSEPATHDDFRQFLDRDFQRRKKFLLEGIAKVIEAPPSSTITVFSGPLKVTDSPDATAVRITTDPTAPMISAPMVDKTHPYRQKELLEKVNTRLPAGKRITTHDFLCIRRTQYIHRDLKYCYNMNWSSPRYSEACVDWLVEQITGDDAFVHRARELYAQIKERKK